MEIVDILNENNEVIGNIPKQEADRLGLLHRTVIAEVIGSDGKWTLIKQASDRQDPGQFVSPIGGHVRSGENELEAIRREANEEYGLPLDIECELVGKKIYYREVCGRKENHYFIIYKINTDKEPILNEESVGYERFSEEQLAKELREKPEKFGDAFHFLVKNFYSNLLIQSSLDT